MSSNDVVLTDALFQANTLQLASPLGANTPGSEKKNVTASEGWLQCFKECHNIKSYRLHGEAESAPLRDLPAFRLDLQNLIDKFALNEVFNSDETGLFYIMAPNKTLAQRLKKFHKTNKARITVLFG